MLILARINLQQSFEQYLYVLFKDYFKLILKNQLLIYYLS